MGKQSHVSTWSFVWKKFKGQKEKKKKKEPGHLVEWNPNLPGTCPLVSQLPFSP